jgi:hypothetical protein
MPKDVTSSVVSDSDPIGIVRSVLKRLVRCFVGQDELLARGRMVEVRTGLDDMDPLTQVSEQRDLVFMKINPIRVDDSFD